MCVVFGEAKPTGTCYWRSETCVEATLQQKAYNKRTVQRYYEKGCT